MKLISLARTAIKSPAQIRKLWRSGPEDRPPEWHPALYTDADGKPTLDEPFSILAKSALEFGELFLALDIAEAGLRALKTCLDTHHPAVLEAVSRLGHCKAMALLRTGSTSTAHKLLEELYKRDRDNLEVATALARTYKDLAFLSNDLRSKTANFQRSHDLYKAAFKATGDVFPGINAAATALWLGRRKRAEDLAKEVATRCRAKLGLEPLDYWLTATYAESQLILRKTGQAERYYDRARSQIDSSHKWANLDSTRKQARRLCQELGCHFTPYEQIFRFPKVVVFSGHMLDAPGRATRRFPASKEQKIRARLHKRLAKLNAGFGISSAACGADFLFIEEMLELGAEVRVVLPWPKKDFIRSSVDIRPDSGAVDRFNNILSRVTSVLYLSQQTEPKETRWGYQYLNECISGLALLGAKWLDAELVPMAVWDGRVGDGPGGTSGFVSFWEEKGRPVEVISLSTGTTRKTPQKRRTKQAQQVDGLSDNGVIAVSRGQETIKTMLFADVLGYTKVPGRETEFFITRFMATISALIDDAADRPILANTWGDAIYMVFDDVIAAGRFALKLRDLVEDTDWTTKGLSTDLSLRISLHTGPVLLCVDPIIRHMTITGAHVSHAARIEPKVTPGEVWASESFAAQAAIAALDRKLGFELDYLGQVELAKGYGMYGLFRVRAAMAMPPERSPS